MDRRSLTLVAFTLIALAPFQRAASTVMLLDRYATGGIPDPGSGSVATLSLEQLGAGVRFRLDNTADDLPNGLGSGAFITKLSLGYAGSQPLGGGSFGDFGGSQTPTAGSFQLYPPGRDAGYDFTFTLEFPQSNSGSARFRPGEHATWTVFDTQVGDFLQATAGSADDALAMAHVQGLSNDASVKYIATATMPSSGAALVPGGTGIPAPATAALLAWGLLLTSRVRKVHRLPGKVSF